MTHKTLSAAIKAGVPDGEHVYEATVSDGTKRYVTAKSPKSAAAKLVQPSLVPQKDMLAAAMELVAGNEQALAAEKPKKGGE